MIRERKPVFLQNLSRRNTAVLEEALFFIIAVFDLEHDTLSCFFHAFVYPYF